MVDRIRLAIHGEFQGFTRAAERALPQAITHVVRRKTLGLKKSLRRQITRSGLGARLGGTLRSQLIPRSGISVHQKGRLFSKAIYKRPGGVIDLLQVFEEGTIIRARTGRFLAIPAQSLLRTRRRITPGEVRGELVFIGHGQPRLVRKENPQEVVFWLVRQVRIKKRLNITATTQRFLRDVGDQIVKDLDRRLTRVEKRFSTT